MLGLPVLVCGLAAAGMVAAGLAGRRMNAESCADPDCKALLAPGIERCPGCEGTIAGTIKYPDERLEAAEAYTRRQRCIRARRYMAGVLAGRGRLEALAYT